MEFKRDLKLDGRAESAFERQETKDFRKRNFRRPGPNTFIHTPSDKKDTIQDYFSQYSEIMKPVLASMDHSKNKEESQAKIERKLMPWISSFNQCLYDARNNQDAHECSDRLIGKLQTEGLDYVKRIAMEY